ncbi:MAG: hypothetical protein JSS56_04995 [Proteobacteria bacterium]|nr:hypothetical protein [Pseudomonadota bacterium]
MPDFAKELQDLKEGDVHMERATAALLTQYLVVRRLRAQDHDTTDARELLDTMRAGVAVLERHRCQVIRSLSEMEQEGGGLAATAPSAKSTGAMELQRSPQQERRRELLEQYHEAARQNMAVQWRMLDPYALEQPLSPAAHEELLASRRRETEALARYLEYVAQCAAKCAWQAQSPVDADAKRVKSQDAQLLEADRPPSSAGPDASTRIPASALRPPSDTAASGRIPPELPKALWPTEP